MQAVLIAVAVLALVWGMHRFLSYAEDRGWVYYRKKRGSYGGLGVTSNFLNMYDPSRKHLQQAAREVEWKRDEDDDGDSPSRKLVAPDKQAEGAAFTKEPGTSLRDRASSR